MQVVNWDDFLQKPPQKESAVTIGVFDGIHLGHRLLIEKVRQSPYTSVVITFKEHPRRVLKSGKAHTDIITAQEKIKILESLGVEVLVLLDFSPEFAAMPGGVFLQKAADAAKMRYIVIGHDFKCGAGGAFTTHDIKEFCKTKNIECEVVPPVLLDGVPVSSSRIRKALAAGDLETARRLRGRGED